MARQRLSGGKMKLGRIGRRRISINSNGSLLRVGGKRITKRELMSRIGYILLGFFTFYMIAPLRTWVDENLQWDPIVIGISGILLVLLLFDF